MPAYAAPLRDHLFCLYELLDSAGHTRLPGFADLSRDVVEAVLEQAGRLATDVLAPLNRTAEEEGARFESGIVTTPGGFREAYGLLCDGGWPGLTCGHGRRRCPWQGRTTRSTAPSWPRPASSWPACCPGRWGFTPPSEAGAGPVMARDAASL